MATTTRRTVVSSIAGAASLAATSSLTSQAWAAGLRQEQLDDYARVYRSAAGATTEELGILLDLQESRLIPSEDIAGFAARLEDDPAIAAMSAGLIPELGMLVKWHQVAMEATARDHITSGLPPISQTYGEQFGPTRSSRAMAIIHLAIFEAVNTIHQKYHSYREVQGWVLDQMGITASQATTAHASTDRAITEAAYTTLIDLYPNKTAIFNAYRDELTARIGDGDQQQGRGAEIGLHAARRILQLRRNDKSDMPDLDSRNFGSADALDWRQDPISELVPALGGNWWRVAPFVLASSSAHRCDPPPSATDDNFISSFKAVKSLGGDPDSADEPPRRATDTKRKGHQNVGPFDDDNESFKAVFWAYDATPLLCAPPRLYNMVATSIALKERPVTSAPALARLLALVNVAMADACIAAWESKYYYAYARPVTVIRRLSVDATSEGRRDSEWTPLGAPVSNGQLGARNLTPPFPAYPSGHAAFGGALFETLRIVMKEEGDPDDFDGVSFEFLSDEYNGENRGPGDAEKREEAPRTFANFSAAEKENGDSRIWLGIHWDFDATAGIEQGQAVAREVCETILTPV